MSWPESRIRTKKLTRRGFDAYFPPPPDVHTFIGMYCPGPVQYPWYVSGRYAAPRSGRLRSSSLPSALGPSKLRRMRNHSECNLVHNPPLALHSHGLPHNVKCADNTSSNDVSRQSSQSWRPSRHLPLFSNRGPSTMALTLHRSNSIPLSGCTMR